MAVYAYDEAVPIPVVDLYDRQMSRDVIAAAKEQYDRAYKEQQDFLDKYGDFLSPSDDDTQYYYDNTIGRIYKGIDDANKSGISTQQLIQSPEGRAYLSRIMNSIPYATLSAIRQNAKDLETYNKLVAQLKAEGLYANDDVQALLNGGFNPNNFSTVDRDGNIIMVGDRSPYKIRSLKDVSEPLFNNRTPGLLNQQQVESLGMKYDPRYQYYGFTQDQLDDIASGFDTTTPEGKAYYYMTAQDLKNATGQTPSDNDVKRELYRRIASANQEYEVRPKPEADPYRKAYYEYQLGEKKANNDLARSKDLARYQASLSDPDGSGSGDNSSLSYTTLVDTQSQANAENSFGVDPYAAYDAVVNEMGKIIPYKTASDKKAWASKYKKLKGATKKRYDELRQYYHSLIDALSAKGKGSTLAKDINEKFGRFETNLSGVEQSVANNILGGGDVKQSPWKGKYRQINLSTGKVRFSPIAKGNALGIKGHATNVFNYNSDYRSFDRFLRRSVRDGWLVDNAETNAIIGNTRYTSGTATIPYYKFLKAAGGSKDKKTGFRQYDPEDQLWTISRLNNIGVRVMTSTGENVTDDMFKELTPAQQRDVVVKVPVTKREAAYGPQSHAYEYDSEYRRLKGGTSFATKNARNDQANQFNK